MWGILRPILFKHSLTQLHVALPLNLFYNLCPQLCFRTMQSMPGSPTPSVAVIGAGIIGASIAVNLSRRGCRVAVIDSAHGPAQGATSKSWAWLNANRKSPAHYKELNRLGMEEWREIASSSGGMKDLAMFPGTVYIGDSRENDPSYPSKQLSSQDIHALEYEIPASLCEQGGRLYKQEGYAYPATAVSLFLEEAERLGATLHFDTEVLDIKSQGNSDPEIITKNGKHTANIVVLAAGLGIPDLAKSLGVRVPLSDKPGTLTVLASPMPKILDHIIVTEEAFILQRKDGEVMISFFKAAVNHMDEEKADQPRSPQTLDHGIADTVLGFESEQQAGHPKEASKLLNKSDRLAQEEIQRAAKIIPDLYDGALESFSVAKYPYPADAHPILGWIKAKKVYVAVTHSGATLGPLLGRLVSNEVLGTEEDDLRHYRPDRDFSNQQHLY